MELLLLLLFGGLMGSMSSDPDDDLSDPETIDTEDPPEAPLDLGATFDAEGTDVTIELGEDETRALAVIYYDKASLDVEPGTLDFYQFSEELDEEDAVLDTYEARFYLVPEAATLSDASWQSRTEQLSLAARDDEDRIYTLEDFEVDQGLELLGAVDLKNAVETNGGRPDFNLYHPHELGLKLHHDVGANALDVTANRPIDEYILSARLSTHSFDTHDRLTHLVPTDYVRDWDARGEVNRAERGIEVVGPETFVSENTTGTSDADWLVATTEGLTLDGQDGKDRLDAPFGNATLIGGEGDDTIYGDQLEGPSPYVRFAADSPARFIDKTDGYVPDIIASGGLGDDIIVLQSGQADGGAGNDGIDILAGEARGGDGDDSITVGITGGINAATAYGEAGNDRFTVLGTNSTAFGGAGEDDFFVSRGATAFGDEGNDEFRIQQRNGDDMTAILTGGAGADTFDLSVYYALDDDDIPYAQITDFDAAEDVLQIGTNVFESRVDTVEIIEDRDANRTDIRVTFTSLDDVDLGAALIRLDGVTGLSVDQIEILD